jgi:hypothetical protein
MTIEERDQVPPAPRLRILKRRRKILSLLASFEITRLNIYPALLPHAQATNKPIY